MFPNTNKSECVYHLYYIELGAVFYLENTSYEFSY